MVCVEDEGWNWEGSVCKGKEDVAECEDTNKDALIKNGGANLEDKQIQETRVETANSTGAEANTSTAGVNSRAAELTEEGTNMKQERIRRQPMWLQDYITSK